MVYFRCACNLLVTTVLLLLSGAKVQSKSVPDQSFPLTLIHINDLHARFEETNQKSSACLKSSECIAGIARVYHTIKSLKEQYKAQNPLYLNAGDNFQGTLWYTLLRWNVTAHFIKQLPPDAMTLGNHEFDHSPKGLAPYLRELEKKRIPTVVANLALNGEPALSESKIARSIVLDVAGRKVGVIGALYDKTHEVSPTGKVTFTNAIEAVRKEAQKLKSDGIEIVIVLSHCGLDVDKQLAEKAGDLFDVIVGAHSHSLLLNKTGNVQYDPKYDQIEGEYPIVVQKANNHKVLITQARSYGKYVGRLTVLFDGKGEIQSWDGNPIYMSNAVPQDKDVLKELIPWRKEVQRLGDEPIGTTEVLLDHASCRWCECTLGSLVADAFVANYTTGSRKPIAIVLAGTFRNSINVGKVTNGLAIEASPYGSSADLVKLTGSDLWEVIEQSLTLDDEYRYNTMQVSGLKVQIDLTKAPHKRVQSIELTETKKPLDKSEEYLVATTSYLADGKNGFDVMKRAKERVTGPLDSDVLIDFIRKERTIKRQRFEAPRVLITKHTNGTCTRAVDKERFTPKKL
uniref:Apyrase n=2 Tax=Nyssorhynchus TaxID=44543 RepID=A0A2M3ZYQ6_9DIPT